MEVTQKPEARSPGGPLLGARLRDSNASDFTKLCAFWPFGLLPFDQSCDFLQGVYISLAKFLGIVYVCNPTQSSSMV